MLHLVVACTFSNDLEGTADAEIPPAPPTPPPVFNEPQIEAFSEEIPPDLALGVREVVTPAGIARIAERRVEVPNRVLDVRVDFDKGDYSGLIAALGRWGFTVQDADGGTARVVAPAGERWAERLEVLPGIARVSETLTQEVLPTGSLRAGITRFDGEIVQAWSVKMGGLVESFEGSPLPPRAELPRTLPTAVTRCLAPLRSAILDGEPAGPGWERALRVEPLAWVAIVEHYGACDATGWFVMEPTGGIEGLTVAGQAPKALTDEALFASAQSYLSVPRARIDDGAIAASDILRRADDTRLAAAIAAIAPGPHQERLLLAFAERNEAAAIELARSSSSPTLRTWGAGVDDQVRAAVLADAAAPADALYAALAAWKPGPQDEARLQALKAHADPRVRMRVWEMVSDQTSAACMERLAGVKALELAAAKELYDQCPQQPVRLQSFARIVQIDRVEAGRVAEATLQRPETVRAGISAVRAANALERDDLLEQIVANPAADRDVRGEALRSLLRVGRSANAQALFEAHGPFLGVRTAPGKAKKSGGR